MICINSRKSIIYFFIVVISLFLARGLLLYFRFFQSDKDGVFENKLYGALVENIPIKVSEINTEEWDEVCILYEYQIPHFTGKRLSYNEQLSKNHRINDIGAPPFFSKIDDDVWWIFFVGKEGEIKDSYRMGSNVYAVIERKDEYVIEGSKYKIIKPDNSCEKRNYAYFLNRSVEAKASKDFIFLKKMD